MTPNLMEWLSTHEASSDGRPTLVWPGGNQLVEVSNPFGLAHASGTDLNGMLAQDPHGGDVALEFWVQVSRESIQNAFENGAKGIVYRLHGATAKHSTPMQYGGFYLERDRELLAEAMTLGYVVVFVVGGEDTYLDVVSDLPAHAIGWDVDATGYRVAEMKEMRSGDTVTTSADSEIRLEPRTGGASIADFLEGCLTHA